MMQRSSSGANGFLAGGYTADAGGTGLGISHVSLDERGVPTSATVLVEADSPSFLAAHPTLKVVYAVLEKRAEVAAFSWQVDANGAPSLTLMATAAAGEAACHLAVSPNGASLVVCCWGSGEVFSYTLGEDGAIAERLAAAPAHDPYQHRLDAPAVQPGAPRRSRAHFAHFVSDDLLVTTDLGYDLIRSWRVRHGRLEHLGDSAMPYGCGPRHIAQLDDGHLAVSCEYTLEVLELSVSNDGTATVLDVIAPPSFAAGDSAAHITATHSRDTEARADATQWLTVGIRGSNRIHRYARVAGSQARSSDVARARFSAVLDAPSGGVKPRFHREVAGILTIAHQGSNEVTSIDSAALRGGNAPGTAPGTAQLALGSPTCFIDVPEHFGRAL